MYEHVTHLNTIPENKGSDTTISERINVLWKGTSFLRANVGGARDSEKTFKAGYLNEV